MSLTVINSYEESLLACTIVREDLVVLYLAVFGAYLAASL